MEVNLAAVHEAIAAGIPGRECLVQGDVRRTWAEVTSRTRALAGALIGHGLGCRIERTDLRAWDCGQDLIAQLMHNSPEYLETMLGGYKARTVPFNVNYRYVASELLHLLRDSRARAVFFHSSYSAVLVEALRDAPWTALLVQVPDASGLSLLPGAQWYEDFLAAGDPTLVDPSTWSPDDLYCCYTGGTTGMPKGVLWRQADAGPKAMQCIYTEKSREFESLAEITERAAASAGGKGLVGPPLMHGAGQWFAFNSWHAGETVVLNDATGFSAEAAIEVVARERITRTVMIGGTFAARLVEAAEASDADLSSLVFMAVGGAVTPAEHKDALLARMPGLTIADTAGSTESGRVLFATSNASSGAVTHFAPAPGTALLSEELDRVLPPGSGGQGWLASTGRIPLGYLNDEAKTTSTFREVDGARWAVIGDRAEWVDDGSGRPVVRLLGRESVTINSGGEKVFAEEVEAVVASHPAVRDCTVVGRPDPVWGQAVVAVVALEPGTTLGAADLVAFCDGKLSRYKIPRDLVITEEFVRGPAGKADYAWARALVTQVP